jgi:tetratricopeptide (TPR) repeat protein
MKRIITLVALITALAAGVDAFGRGGGFGGGGGHFGGGFSGGGDRGFSGGGNFGGRDFGGFSYGGGQAMARPSWNSGANYSRPSYIPQSRPSFNGGNFQNFDRSNFNRGNFNNFAGSGNAARQTIVNRPNFEGNNPFSQTIHPDAGIGNRANISQNVRPDWNAGNRANIDNRTNIGNLNRNWSNNINHWANNNHPWANGYNHYDHWHNGWHHGYWPYWGGNYPWAWFGAGAALGWWASPGTTYVYSNPYYIASDDVDDGYNYSQPIPAPTQTEQALYSEDSGGIPPPSDQDQSGGQTTYADSSDPNTQQAVAIFDSGRALFKQGDYQGALDKTDQAIKLLPSDATLHEFRGACLFALKNYQQAAATIYAVLAAGPGWDWDTMKALYPDTAVYTAQLRALEDYKKANPDKPDASFLLAYEYLVLGYPDQAAAELQQVVKLQPTDKLSAAILKAIQNRNNPQQQPAPSVTES